MKKNKAFTLVELLVVIAILAILATVSVVGYTSFLGKAKASNCKTEGVQAREVIRAQVISSRDQEVKLSSGASIKYSQDLAKTVDETTGKSAGETGLYITGTPSNINSELLEKFPDLNPKLKERQEQEEKIKEFVKEI